MACFLKVRRVFHSNTIISLDWYQVRLTYPQYAGKPLFHILNHPIKWVRFTGVVVAVDDYTNKEGGRRVYTLDDSSGMCIECAALNPPVAPKVELDLGKGLPRHLEQLASIVTVGRSEAKAKEHTNGKGNNTQGRSGKEDAEGREVKPQPSVQAPNVPWGEVDIGTVVKIKGKIVSRWKAEVKQVEVIKIEVLKCTDAEVKCWDEVRSFRHETLGKVWVLSPEEEKKCREIKERELRKLRKTAAERRGGVKVVAGERGKERLRDDQRKRKADQEEEKPKRRRENEPTELGKKNMSNYPSYVVKRVAGS
jgi:hypothetical protein